MHLKKPAVISVRVPWGTRVLIEEVALKAGVPYSDFVRMALLIGARQQAAMFGVDVETRLDALPELISGKVPTYLERLNGSDIRGFISSGEVPEDWEERFDNRMIELGIRR